MTATAAVACTPEARVTRSLLGYGVIAGPLYVTVSLAQAFTREGIDPTRHAWSMLANGRLGWIQTLNLVLTGLMVVAAAAGVRRAAGRGGVPLAIYGVGMVLAGFFRADPGRGFPPGAEAGALSWHSAEAGALSWHGAVHLAAAGVGFAGLVAATFVLAREVGGLWSRTVGVVFVAAFVAMNASAGAAWAIVAFSVAVGAVSVWLSALSVRLYRTVR